MKNYSILLLAGVLTLSSCASSSEWGRGVTGAYVGSMFGSLIGDIIGGPRGGDMGALIGGAAGAAVGAASARAEQEKYENSRRNNNHQDYSYDDIYYGNGRDYSYYAPSSPADYLEISNIVFADDNNNRVLEGYETAYITFDIHNRSGQTIYNIAPVITCDNKRIQISPTATIAQIASGKGMRYKCSVRAQQNVKSGVATFNIGFAEQGNRTDPAKTFRINVRR